MVFFCDHENPEPEMLYQDKTYVARISYSVYQAHGETYEEAKAASPMLEGRLEYVPLSLSSQLYESDGSQVADEFQNGRTIFEVTESFYETDTGKRILNMAETMGYVLYTQPVTGTNKTCLPSGLLPGGILPGGGKGHYPGGVPGGEQSVSGAPVVHGE